MSEEGCRKCIGEDGTRDLATLKMAALAASAAKACRGRDDLVAAVNRCDTQNQT
jgi:hypothetical protein